MGKWATTEYERVLHRKIKHLFSSDRDICPTQNDGTEIKFQQFIKNLNVSDPNVQARFGALYWTSKADKAKKPSNPWSYDSADGEEVWPRRLISRSRADRVVWSLNDIPSTSSDVGDPPRPDNHIDSGDDEERPIETEAQRYSAAYRRSRRALLFSPTTNSELPRRRRYAMRNGGEEERDTRRDGIIFDIDEEGSTRESRLPFPLFDLPESSRRPTNVLPQRARPIDVYQSFDSSNRDEFIPIPRPVAEAVPSEVAEGYIDFSLPPQDPPNSNDDDRREPFSYTTTAAPEILANPEPTIAADATPPRLGLQLPPLPSFRSRHRLSLPLLPLLPRPTTRHDIESDSSSTSSATYILDAESGPSRPIPRFTSSTRRYAPLPRRQHVAMNREPSSTSSSGSTTTTTFESYLGIYCVMISRLRTIITRFASEINPPANSTATSSTNLSNEAPPQTIDYTRHTRLLKDSKDLESTIETLLKLVSHLPVILPTPLPSNIAYQSHPSTLTPFTLPNLNDPLLIVGDDEISKQIMRFYGRLQRSGYDRAVEGAMVRRLGEEDLGGLLGYVEYLGMCVSLELPMEIEELFDH